MEQGAKLQGEWQQLPGRLSGRLRRAERDSHSSGTCAEHHTEAAREPATHNGWVEVAGVLGKEVHQAGVDTKLLFQRSRAGKQGV